MQTGKHSLSPDGELFGFSANRTGGHMARSMMLTEMKQLHDSLPLDASLNDYRNAIEDRNVLAKPTQSSRHKSYRHLVELYGLDFKKPIFRTMRRLAKDQPADLPLLAMLCVYGRDPQANLRIETLLGKVIAGARVFLSGGAEQPVMGLREAVEDAAVQVVDRIFPKFSTADSDKWGSVWKRAKEGNANALEALGYKGDPDKHPVSKEILLHIGAGKKGAEVVKQFTGGEYGWPKDAVDATIASLMVSGYLLATLDAKPISLAISLGDLDQRSLGKVSLKTAHPVLTATQKLVVKKLFTTTGLKFTPGDEAAAATRFVVLLKELAASSGGEAPAPEAPKLPLITDLEGLQGHDLLFRLFEESTTLTANIVTWQNTARAIAQKLPVFQTAEHLLRHASDSALPGMGKYRADLDAVRDGRSLLDEPDPVSPVLQAVATALRQAVRDGQAQRDLLPRALAGRRSGDSLLAPKLRSRRMEDACRRPRRGDPGSETQSPSRVALQCHHRKRSRAGGLAGPGSGIN